ncbi:hypothetical protein CAL18_17175 [Bordetella genomosp. 7]|uniref:SnoaL-like domain-containing protein n=1 Tax=Bordetella genomosp. 7 TaxID=1416805 RepID=A0A261QUJ7_9BORD|nr:hypothetical protein [Bordetella genomosp. 7]OZI15710.1 hypothetical protein CAL18_17175 [Bordetella genomosp. 7]OZI16458.1 hypothetical protein CAL19_17420 [Bordetella genomosp. 7]
MPSAIPTTTAALMRNYLRAKDENRPLYMARAFASDAVLKMTLRTPAIAFPPEARGLDAITEALVRTFGQTYENVFTFYLAHPGEHAVLTEYACDWFVGMTEKNTGRVRIGCGSYDWEFQAAPHLARKLTITIETMLSLPPDTEAQIFGWLASLPYPWIDARNLVNSAPPIEALAPVMHWIRRADRDAYPLDGTA